MNIDEAKRWAGSDRSQVLRVDCDTCTVRGAACGDCVIAVLLGPPGDVELDGDEQAALSALASSGLVPPLRLVQAVDEPCDDGWGDPGARWG